LPNLDYTVFSLLRVGRILTDCAFCASRHVFYIAPCAVNFHHLIISTHYTSPMLGTTYLFATPHSGFRLFFVGFLFLYRTYLHPARHSRCSKHSQVLMTSDILAGSQHLLCRTSILYDLKFIFPLDTLHCLYIYIYVHHRANFLFFLEIFEFGNYYFCSLALNCPVRCRKGGSLSVIHPPRWFAQTT
jgi:hypothetical protein